MDVLPEIAVYGLTAAVAIAVGVSMTAPATGPTRWLGCVSVALITLVVVVAAFALAGHAPWMGAVYALVAGVTVLLVAAAVQRDRPALLAEPYWRRVVLIALHGRRLASVDTQPTEHASAR